MEDLNDIIKASLPQKSASDLEKNKKKRYVRRGDAQVEASRKRSRREKSKHQSEQKELEEESFLAKSEVIRLLRERGQPVTLFGEMDADRLSRLRKLEKEGLGVIEQQRETGLKHGFSLEEEEEDEDEEDAIHNNKESDQQSSSAEPEGGSSSVKAKKETKEGKVISFIKRMLREWEETLEQRPEEVQRSVQGRKDKANYKQCKQYVRPFVKLLKKQAIAPDILDRVCSIVSLCEQREYVQAGDAYVKLAIGNAAWPIGVTMVGIHARKGREKINQDNVSHVMNDEAQRKYITSLKRIMTFCQSKYPTDPSRMLM